MNECSGPQKPFRRSIAGEIETSVGRASRVEAFPMSLKLPGMGDGLVKGKGLGDKSTCGLIFASPEFLRI